MRGNSAFRRVFHIISPVFLAYYLIPEALGGGITRTGVTLLVLGTAACIEVARMALGIPLLGLRSYEGRRVSAYAQGALGLAFGIFLIGDATIVVPVFVGMAWIDPLAALARRRNWPRAVVAASYFGLFLAIEILMGTIAVRNSVFFAAVVAAAALVVEGPKIAQLDDDLMMQVVPYVVMYYLVAGFGTGQPALL